MVFITTMQINQPFLSVYFLNFVQINNGIFANPYEYGGGLKSINSICFRFLVMVKRALFSIIKTEQYPLPSIAIMSGLFIFCITCWLRTKKQLFFESIFNLVCLLNSGWANIILFMFYKKIFAKFCIMVYLCLQFLLNSVSVFCNIILLLKYYTCTQIELMAQFRI